MKYIECNNCQKRYPANSKMEAAALRKKVRCTACGASFPIVIYEVKPQSDSNAEADKNEWSNL